MTGNRRRLIDEVHFDTTARECKKQGIANHEHNWCYTIKLTGFTKVISLVENARMFQIVRIGMRILKESFSGQD